MSKQTKKTRKPKRKGSRASIAAQKYVGYHEYICGNPRGHAFEMGFEAGYRAATVAARQRQRKIERANSDLDRISPGTFLLR